MAKSVKSTAKKRARNIRREQIHKPIETLRLKRLAKAQEKQTSQVLSKKDLEFYANLKEEYQREKEAGVVFNEDKNAKKSNNKKKVPKAIANGKKKVSKKSKLDF